MNIEIPPGYGLRLLPKSSWFGVDPQDSDSFEALMGKLLVWEAPKPGHHYIMGVDVSAGIGLDRSVIDVLRAPTISEPAEQVAQFVTDDVAPVQLSYIIDPIGRFYRDDDGQEALCAIENNNHGLSTQSELQGHLGYTNFYVWQRFDIRNPAQRFSRTIGWETNRRTRPMIIDFFKNAVETVDPLTGVGDVIINSPFTLSEMRNFQVPEGYPTWMAEAADGLTDDTIFAAMISLFISHMERFSESEPLNEQRRRLHEEKLRKQFMEENTGMRRTYQNTLVSADEMWGVEEQVYERGEGEKW